MNPDPDRDAEALPVLPPAPASKRFLAIASARFVIGAVVLVVCAIHMKRMFRDVTFMWNDVVDEVRRFR